MAVEERRVNPTDPFYTRRRAYQTPAEQLGWATAQDQYAGFAALLGLAATAFPLAGLRVHDAGCGYGDFFPLVQAHGIADYVGTDCMDDALAKAQVEHPKASFHRLDLFTDPLPQADVTFVHGTLAFHTPQDIVAMLRRLRDASDRALAFRCWWHDNWIPLRMAVTEFMDSTGDHRFQRIGDYGLWFEGAFVLVK